ncbi:MAG TPA: serine/threonine-protein kinase, partial [Candidatus Nitrosotenuis sp.]|jgi:serine/threonine-protein kinase|nr:serine/threonine-protein kinase [Candidatus Nitrosotenuis sp.]
MLETHRRPILQGDYKLVRILERLDYSTVFLAVSLHNPARRFAIKRVQVEFESELEMKETLKAFRAQALRYAELDHPGLALLHDFFYENGCEYIVWEYVPGHRLSEVMEMRNRPFTEAQALDIAIRLAESLAWLHSLKPPVYFADLNPHNVILMPRGKVKMTDYGLGKLLARRDKRQPRLGTLGYAPPEQHGKEARIGRTNDIYALGVLMHHLVTGRDPGTSPGVFPPIHDLNPAISEDFQIIVSNATHPDPNQRYHDMKYMLADLQAICPARRAARQRQASFLKRLGQVLVRPFVAA